MRVVSWNLWWRFGPWRERQKAILAVLRELRPDVVGLQEVWAAGGENLAQWLADELGLHCTWAASPSPDRWRARIADADADAGSVDIGNAVLSRWPVTEQETLLLPAPADLADGRLALYARVAAPAFDIPFFTTHLTSAVQASAVRCTQVTALAELVARHRGGTPCPPVVTGDFNAWPDSDEVRLFAGTRTAPAVPGLVMFDAWDYADPTAPAATWTPENPYAARLLEPPARIDYIHVGPPGPAGEGHVRRVQRAGQGPVDGVWPSDHAAVVADLAEGETAII
ncbi:MULTISPECIES: endonuclease/exonuclease/phosphatase family protein [Streptomyces]|jgi:endonuclease/exonuclease/phosphatase family metal-dependent hydrolase|uniref:Endonuclease/exonuclease/phosphatase family protein n=1 Tax=Streptomyces sp. 900129855 TaxID=3155129 RepID=A0ABV2ZH14_9ACTN